MAKKEWRGVNDLYFHRSQKTEQKKKPVTLDDEPYSQPQKDEPEVRLLDATWLPGSDGYQFNKKCKLQIKAKFLKKTSNKRVVADTFVLFNGEEEDLSQQVVGFLNDDGIAEAELMLYYGDRYSDALRDDPNATCQYKCKVKHTKGANEIESELLDMPQEDKCKVNVVEVPDITFNLNSAIPCLDEKNKFISSIVTTYQYGSEHNNEELVICGHTDSSGEFEYNYDLSELRAKSIKSLLDNDSSTWSSIAKKQSKVEDYQTILKTLTDVYGWSSDPGKIDNIDGPKTQEALKYFQSKYNGSLKEDGKIGPETWKAIHSVIVDIITHSYKKLTEEETLPKLDFRQSDGGIYPCGESFPIDNKYKDDYQSKVNRRIDLAFYQKEKPPELKKTQEKGSKISNTLCQIYNTVASLFSIIKPKEVKPEPIQKDIKLKIEYPDKSPHKQHINLKSNDKENGSELKIKVKAEDAQDKQVIYWKVTADTKNSKRNKPEPGLTNPANNEFVKIDKDVAKLETEVKSEITEAILCCGLAGGDKFIIEVGYKQDEWAQKLEVINWRKLWYQRTYHKSASVLSMKTSETKLKDEFIEFIAEQDVKHSLGTAGSVIVGNHNASEYHKLLKTTHADQCVNGIFCDKQFDGLKSGKNITIKGTKSLTKNKGSIEMSRTGSKPVRIFNPPLQKNTKFLLEANWINAKLKKKGNLTDDKSKTNDNTGLLKYDNEHRVLIELPKNANPSKTNKVDVTIKVTAASGPWGGDGGTAPHNLIVIDKNDTIHSQCVMHELGHLMNMVPYPGYYKYPPGFKYKDHSTRYIEMGGAGSHCHYKHDKNKSTPKKYVDGRCIMFHQLNNNCQLSYCTDCSKFIKAQTLQKFKDL